MSERASEVSARFGGYGQVEEWNGVVVNFMLGGDQPPDEADDIDAHIYLPDGTHRYATFFTTDRINKILRGYVQSAENGGGRYFWWSDLVIVPRPGIPAMMEAIEEMVRSGAITEMCGIVQEHSDEDD